MVVAGTPRDREGHLRATKDFGWAEPLGEEDQIGFTLGGQQFRCVPASAVPAGAIIRWTESAITVEESGILRRVIPVAGYFHAIEALLIDEDAPKLREIVENKQRIIDVDKLDEVWQWVLSQYAERPTAGRSASSDAPSPTASSSEENSPVSSAATPST